jgi:hypothetical protein
MSQQYPDLYVLVTTKTVEVPIPALEPIDIIGMQVNALRAKKEKSLPKQRRSWVLLKTRFSSCCASITLRLKKATYRF